ncbi:hypothetical protein GCM10007862_25670 [Dyella lipolytica]|uniref:Uncharacterized protein n=1 Tax=Dyella lipolytica TaxID=1867835 RepID=A0ABW8IUH0_9GAMM|nr:hypothetical protein [Dyella lipolytica]GLQ47516.1 hypothetical protein GCM10007862_25670 [Dyella lipolytica]
MSKSAIKSFIEAMCNAEQSGEGPPLWVSVKYVGDQTEYQEWVPTSTDRITDKGLKDPGFGSGPVEYEDIHQICVHSTPKLGAASDAYAKKYETLLLAIKNTLGAKILVDMVVFKNVE